MIIDPTFCPTFYVPGNWRQWALDKREDIAGVITHTERDDTGVNYDVSVVLRSLAEHAYEEGEDQRGVWGLRVEFGQTDATVAGGFAFVEAAREQQLIADTIAGIVWGNPAGRAALADATKVRR